MKIGKYLRRVRTALGISQIDAAKMARIGILRYRYLERDDVIIRVTEIRGLETTFELPEHTLLDKVSDTDKKAIYIVHPLRENVPDEKLGATVQRNYKKITSICNKIASSNDDILILSPIHAFSFFDTHGDQTEVLSMCANLLERVDEVWVYGNWQHSEGCRHEIKNAEALKIPVLYKDTNGERKYE